jgi:hypothetical protein
MAATATGPVQFRGIGGVYKVAVQDATNDDDYTLLVNWLSSTVATALGHSRIYNRYAPEQADIGAGQEFVTYFWKRADPDKYTHDRGTGRTRVSVHYVEVLVWAQGKTYAGIAASAARLVGALDVGATTTADGVILGAERESFLATAAE